MNYYELLQVQEDATEDIIRAARKTLIKKYHPDTYKGDKKYAENKTKEINEAFEVLSDSNKRKAYDLFLKQQRESQKERVNTSPINDETKLKKKVVPINKKWIWLLVSLLIFACVMASVGFSNNSSDDKTNTTENSPQEFANKESYIDYDAYYVGVRTISISDKFTAEYVYSKWESGPKTEEYMIQLMDKYGESQGGGQLYIIQPGDFVNEVDEWCFDRNRQIGDAVMLETEYGYTICYLSSVQEK